MVLKVLHLFQTTLDRNSVEIAQAVGQEDWRALKSVAHGLKGASYNVGAMKLGDCCRQLETVAALAMSHQLAARMSDFNAELSRVRAELRMLLSS